MARYHSTDRAPEVGAVILDTLEAVCLEGAGRMLAAALKAELDAFLERPRCPRRPLHRLPQRLRA
jgi:hypothetical protein